MNATTTISPARAARIVRRWARRTAAGRTTAPFPKDLGVSVADAVERGIAEHRIGMLSERYEEYRARHGAGAPWEKHMGGPASLSYILLRSYPDGSCCHA